MAVRDHLQIRLRSSRAPYTRGGIEFASNRETVTVPGDAITDDQLRRLSGDTAIGIEVVDARTGEPAFLILDDGLVLGDPVLIAADAEAREKVAVEAAAGAAEGAATKAAKPAPKTKGGAA